MGSVADEYTHGDTVDVAGELNINLYNGTERVQLVLNAIRPSRFSVADALPSRGDFADIYRYIKRLPQPVFAETTALSKELSRSLNRRIMRDKLMNALRVFADVGILEHGVLGESLKIELAPNMDGKKFNLAESREYIRIKAALEQLAAKGGAANE